MAGLTANDVTKLREVHAPWRPKFQQVIEEMRAAGEPVKIHEAWRSQRRQAELLAAGHSKVPWSPHNAVTVNGGPDACAIDVIHADLGWNAPIRFWMRLLAYALRADLRTGILFGLEGEDRAAIKTAAMRGDWSYSGPKGWDSAHIEIVFPYASLKAGLRPPAPEC